MNITNKILNKVKETIKEYNMFELNDTVVIGVSGGADSVMLFHVLNLLKTEYNLHLIVAHINHKIRLGDAEKDAIFVENLCKEYDVEFHLKEAYIKDLAKEWNMGEEEAGRKVRYDFFAELAGQNGKIATAHNANDNVETVLMRMMRGTGITGLKGISYKRDNIVRPILGISRSDIEDYVEENKLNYITDKTNFESIYTRNKIRLELIPFMQNMFNPNLVNTITQNIKTYSEDADFLEEESEKVYFLLIQRDDTNSNLKLNLKDLLSLHPSLAKRVIIKSIKEIKNSEQIDISADKIDFIFNSLTNKVGTKFTLNGGFQIRIDYDCLVLEKSEESLFMEDIIVNLSVLEQVIEVPSINSNLRISVCFDECIDNNDKVCYLPYEEFKETKLILRSRKNGDIFRITDKSHKKLNKVFTDRKISSGNRDKIVCLCTNNEVLWALDYFATRYNQRSGSFFKLELI